jgi:hypothetical protein
VRDGLGADQVEAVEENSIWNDVIKCYICTIYVFIDACVKIDTISNLCACLFGQQLTKYLS